MNFVNDYVIVVSNHSYFGVISVWYFEEFFTNDPIYFYENCNRITKVDFRKVTLDMNERYNIYYKAFGDI